MDTADQKSTTDESTLDERGMETRSRSLRQVSTPDDLLPFTSILQNANARDSDSINKNSY